MDTPGPAERQPREPSSFSAAHAAGCTRVDAQPGTPGPGPLLDDNQHAWGTTAAVGEAFTDGMEVLRFEGDKGAVLTSVELVDADGMEIVGVKLAGRERDTRSN